MAKRDPLYLDADATTHLPSYNGLEMRGALNAFQPGVVGAGDFKVTAGAGLTLDSAAGRGVVLPTAGAVVFPGLYYAVDDASENSATFERTGGGTGIPANPSTNPRLDAVVIHVYDHALDGSGRRAWVREYVPGVAASGAALGGTLPSLPSSSLLLAEVLVPANNPTTIPSANIRDRRPWAKGAHTLITRRANAAGGSDYTTTSTGFVDIDAANLARRVECSGVTVKLRVAGRWQNSGTSKMVMRMNMDGTAIDGEVGPAKVPPAANTSESFDFTYEATPSAGSHVFSPAWLMFGGTGTILASGAFPFQFSVEEVGRQNSDNT